MTNSEFQRFLSRMDFELGQIKEGYRVRDIQSYMGMDFFA